VRRADHRARPGDIGRDRSVDDAHPRALAGDRNRRDARHAQRLHRGGPHRHAVRGQGPPGGDRGPDSGDGGSRGAAVHRGTPDVKIYAGTQPPPKPAVIAASASLFGEWAASLVPVDQLPNDPNIRQAITDAQAAGSGKWPGATLPDIGQLTAQASRIATDIATV